MRAFRRIGIAALAMLCCFPALAAEDAVKITSDRFVVDQGANEATFSGSVEIDQGANEATFSGSVEIDQPGLTVWADKVVVHYGPGGPSDLKDFEASGHVKVRQPEQTATSDKGVYNPTTRILVLTGNVVVNNASGTVRGPELKVNVATGLSEFSGKSGSRVTGIFTPQPDSAGE